MINLCNTEPPKAVEVNGGFYSIDYDFRTWLKVTELLQNIKPDNSDDAVEKFIEVENLVFGKIIDEPAEDVLTALYEFAKGYPDAIDVKIANGEHVPDTVSEPVISFKYDLSYIIIAIRNQSGIDLSYRRKEPFHWWEFLLEVETLNDSHYISYLMRMRGYKGTDKDQMRLKQRYSLPIELTDAERRAIEELEAQLK